MKKIEVKIISEDSMMCKMPDNTDYSANSKFCQDLCEGVPTKNNNNAELMTEAELIHFLRIPEISGSKNYHNVIEHLKKFRGSPRIHICRKALYPKKAVLEWLEKETNLEK